MAKATTASASDIRNELPTAVKGGSSSSPKWDINGKTYQYLRPANAKGQDPSKRKVRTGDTRVLAKYVASKTKSGKDLVFVGVFAPVETAAVS